MNRIFICHFGTWKAGSMGMTTEVCYVSDKNAPGALSVCSSCRAFQSTVTCQNEKELISYREFRIFLCLLRTEKCLDSIQKTQFRLTTPVACGDCLTLVLSGCPGCGKSLHLRSQGHCTCPHETVRPVRAEAESQRGLQA